MRFVAKRWLDMTNDPKDRALRTLPSNFWMNSIGGKTANKGHWVTALFYTENEVDANAFKDVLLRWQAKGMQGSQNSGSGLINIDKKK